MKVLVLNNKVGGGHTSTAKAIIEELEKNPSVEIRVLDSVEYISPLLQKSISKGYILSTSKLPVLYAGQYRYNEIMDKTEKKDAGLHVVNELIAKKLLTYFKEDFYPDIVICTHIFSGEIINLMLEKEMIDVVAIGIVTDFTIHPHWCRLSHFSYFVTAGELLTYQAVKKGIDKSKILPFGIPVGSEFTEYIDKAAAKQSIGINPSKKVLLLMFGSMGYGNIGRCVKETDDIEDDFIMLIVCGNNKKIRATLIEQQSKFKHDSIIYGFVHDIDVMMSASDVIITKPGGLSTCEALCKELPMILINPIPGQETRNLTFLTNNGIAYYADEITPIDELYYQMFYSEQKYENLVRNIKLIKKPEAAKELSEFILSLKS